MGQDKVIELLDQGGWYDTFVSSNLLLSMAMLINDKLCIDLSKGLGPILFPPYWATWKIMRIV